MIQNLPPQQIFFIGLGILLLFFWYFASDVDKKKQLIGTALAVLITIFCLLCIIPPEKNIQLGMDLSGGVRFTLGLTPPEGRILNTEAQDQAIGVLEKRLNQFGTSDVRIAKEGKERIVVDIPNRGKQKIDNEKLVSIEKILTKQAILNFHMEHKDFWQNPSQFVGKLKDIYEGKKIGPINSSVFTMKDKSTDGAEIFFLAHKYPDVIGKWVTSSFAFFGQSGYEISLNLSGEGAKKFYDLSKNNVNNNRRLAIVLDGVVQSALGFREPIPGGRCSISGDFTQDEANALASAMTNPLETPVEILHKEYFPAQLGKSAIQQGINAGILGLSLTIIFMLIYYKIAGLVAIIGLTINIILLFGIMAIFKFDFTMPGIAGVILTLGISIDANVLIFERLREEIAAGKSTIIAIKTAYQKAFSAIFDANITTLITAGILFSLATGTVKGFAVTLMIGIIVSLFTSLLVTRISFNWLQEFNLIKKINFLNILKRKKFNFLSKTKISFVFSITLIIIALAVIGVKNSNSLGIEFTGGEAIKFETNNKSGINEKKIRVALSSLNLKKTPTIERLQPTGSSNEFYSIKLEKGMSKKAHDALKNNANFKIGEIAITEVSGVIAGEMLKKSIISLAIALIAILFYVSIRFEFSFAVGAITALIHDLIICAGIIIITGHEISLVLIGAFLTIAGYSINDTIVVFDRIRESLQTEKGSITQIMNKAINTTLSRTILTSLTTILTVFSLYIFGGAALKEFAFAIIIGVFVGTYSSMFVASPIVHLWSKKSSEDLRTVIMESEQVKNKAIELAKN